MKYLCTTCNLSAKSCNPYKAWFSGKTGALDSSNFKFAHITGIATYFYAANELGLIYMDTDSSRIVLQGTPHETR